MQKIAKYLLLVCLAGFLAACSTGPKPLYYWGNYSDAVYHYYKNEEPIATQIDQVQEIIHQGQESKLAIAPGIYGHLGLLYLKQGNGHLANQYFTKEASLYPESKQFIQFLSKKQAKNGGQK